MKKSLIFVMLLKSFLKCITLGNVIFFNWVTLIFRDKLFHCIVYTALVGGRVLWENLRQDCRGDFEQRGELFYDVSKV